MYGFNKFFPLGLILISMLLSGCVPQPKTTECGSNEAFSSSLRACVPVNPHPNNFVSVSSATPTAPITVYAQSPVAISLTVMVNNPYARNYRMKWVRSHNGVDTQIGTTSAASNVLANHPYNISLTPSTDLLGSLGTHTISLQLLDSSSSTILDSHDFQIYLTNAATPFGNGFNPTIVVPVLRSPSPSVNDTFTITVHKNGSTLGSPQVAWSLNKLTGTALAPRSENDNLTLIGASSSDTASITINSANPMNNGVPPVAPFSSLIGTYRLTASIIDGATTYATYAWDYTISHPTIGVVSTATLPVPAVGGNTITAINGIDYSNMTLPSFSYASGATRAQMCVQVSTPAGRYNGGVNVSYYLGSNTSPVFTGTTNAGDDTICLSDAGPATQALINFSDPNFSLNWSTSIRARVFDVATGEEYSTYTPGTYPPVWALAVKPQNTKPTIVFTDPTNLVNVSSCTYLGAIATCQVTQDTTFTLGVSVTDDFYNPAVDQDKFTYSMVLRRNGSPVPGQTCTKTALNTTTNDPTTNTDFVGPDYLCSFTISSYDSSTPIAISPLSNSYTVDIVVSDTGSPFNGTGLPSSTYSYVISPLIESQTTPSIAPQGINTTNDTYLANSATPTTPITGAGFITEGNTLQFSVLISDNERDTHNVSIFRCTDATCSAYTSATPITSKNEVRTTNALAVRSTVSYLIPEDFLPSTTPLTSDVLTYFHIQVTDATSTLPASALDTTTAIVSLNIRNKNPPPVISGTGMNPSVLTGHTVAVGYPFSINPGTITDASLVSSEGSSQVFDYQWYVSVDGGTVYNSISGANEKTLYWTPSSAIASGTVARLRMCVGDKTTIYPVNNLATCVTESRATGIYQVTVVNNQTIPPKTGVLGSIDKSRGAIWYDSGANAHVAYLTYVEVNGSTHFIVVEKLIRNSTTFVLDTSFNTVRFQAIDGDDGSMPEELSISGSTNSLFIAYKCALASSPTSTSACVRRIEKGYATASKTALTHPGKFGFSYSAITITEDDANINYTTPVNDAPYTIDFPGVPTSGSQVVVNGVSFTVVPGAVSNPTTEICSLTTPGCTNTIAASQLATAINSNPSPLLQGFTATAAGSSVTIEGMKAGDYWNSTDVGVSVGGIGKIIVHDGRWHLPVINSSLPGVNLNRVSVFSGLIDQHLWAFPPSSVNLTSADRAANIVSDLDTEGNMVIALISLEPSRVGQGRLYKVTYDMAGSYPNANLVQPPSSLFAGESLSNLRVAASRTSNNFSFVVAYGNVTDKWKIGRFDKTTLALSNTTEQNLDSLTAQNGSNDIITPADVADIQVITDPFINGEARLLVTNIDATNRGLYFMRFSSIYVLSCAEDSLTIPGACFPINNFTIDNNTRAFASTVQQNVTIGTPGNAPTENITDIMHVLMFTSTADVRYAYLNVVPESIQGNETSGTAGTSGWRPPYIR